MHSLKTVLSKLVLPKLFYFVSSLCIFEYTSMSVSLNICECAGGSFNGIRNTQFKMQEGMGVQSEMVGGYLRGCSAARTVIFKRQNNSIVHLYPTNN